MIDPQFVHLHVHSDYSIIDGLSKPEDLVKKAALLGMKALAINDFNNLYGVIKFYNTAHTFGLKPIIGVTVKFFSEYKQYKLTELVLLAVNQKGYKNLILIISKSFKKGYIDNYSITIKKKWLSEINEGLIVLSGGCKGEIGKALLYNHKRITSDCISFYEKYFPNAHYLELVRTGKENEEKYIDLALELSLSKNIPVVATNDVCFLTKEDYDAHRIRIAINEGKILKDSKIQNNYSDQQFLKTEKDMCDLFHDIPVALVNSVEIAKRCNVFINSGEYFLPQFPTGKISVEDYLVIEAYKGINKRLNLHHKNHKNFKNIYKEYKNRLDIELNIINQMGFPGYFLIVMEFIKWAKDNGVPVGPGRGSGASSLVAYALQITEVDPLSFDLVFERFLNSERISMPDFDIDFCMEKRDKVIEHVADMYGRSSVAQIITFGTMTAKAVIKDVGRVLGYSYGFINNISKLIPSDPGITLKEAFSRDSELSSLYKSNEDVKILINMSKKLEGTNRNVGKHAGGLVISPTKITDFCPLYYDNQGKNPVTQFDKNDIEFIGLVKFDFLGLRTLTIINYAIKMINKNLKLNNRPILNINSINLNDSKCFELLKKSHTTAIFQLESYGMKDLIKRLQPDCFEDLIALVALFRPGPLQSGMVDNFINRKHGREKISYPDNTWQHMLLKPVLESTYGIVLYQEQVMKIAQVLAGYSLGEADILRRAMSKKNLKDMIQQRSIFEKRAYKNGINQKLAIKIFDLLEKFAGYGFNKSHSVAYALVSYQTLWLKKYYPLEFMASAMTSDIDNTDKIVILINESISMGLQIKPPNVNLSRYEFYVSSDSIIYGLGAIKGIGSNSINHLISERNKNGEFQDLFDLCMRIDLNKITKKILEKLIMSGSCDCFNSNRSSMLKLIESAIKVSKEYTKSKNFVQESLFGNLKNDLIQVKNNHCLHSSYSEQVKLDQEYQVLGLYLTGHPTDQYLEELKHYSNGLTLLKALSIEHDKKISVTGIIVSIKIKRTKNKNRMAVILLDDNSSRLEIIIFERLLETCEPLLNLNKILIISGVVKVNAINKSVKMIAYSLMNLDMAREKYINKIIVTLKKDKDMFFLENLYNFLEKQIQGKVLVCIVYEKKLISSDVNINKKWFVCITDELINKFKILVKSDKIKLNFY
ncbi:DNA polymerase III subunit alpha [Buchnera aphidicola (Muscaphis stroyani)]|uniref:DNA polymerase III subunit alpha n=1 Tax=Buchnera aphidicola (Muscaphis stroyani) TaxID=1241869 RepID=A0A4D6Y4G9_9GAMM|nr:DNA polymerase III subunit alpha [Buchnera aphidicola]QCI24322.1 DNA polymerase III subunit alpha [Buchnera aphidicola (Muscaphis stroyani)]